jgi:dipeptidyl aminopeptidase/acylaminoacyl peptidase
MKSFILLLSVCISLNLSAQKITIQDIIGMEEISSPACSPDGKLVAFTKSIKSDWQNKANADIWICSTDGKTNLQLTTSEKRDANPRWSPSQDKIGFISDRGTHAQVYYINLNGGEAIQFTNSQNDVLSFTWLGDTSVVYLADEPRDSSVVNREKRTGGAVIVGTEYNTSTLWYKTLNKEANKIIDRKNYISNFSLSPNGKNYAIIGSPNSEPYNIETNGFVSLLNEKGEELFKFSEGEAFQDVKFSPSGDKLAFTGSVVGYSSRDALWVLDLKTMKLKNYTEELSPTIMKICWLDDESITFLTLKNAYRAIYSVDLKSEQINTLLDPYYIINDYDVSNISEALVFIGCHGFKTNQLFIIKQKAKAETAIQLTNLNGGINKRITVSSEIIQYTGSENDMIEALLTLPPEYNRNIKYPLVVLPHGGPDGVIQDGFRAIPLFLAQEGFIVFEPNFHGSIGYGSKFYASNRGLLGEIDYTDIMQGVDFLIKEERVDSNKMVVGGWSYGGYMTNWIIGHTNRFKAAVTVAGISNTVSMYSQSDINHGDLARWEFKGVPVLNMENFQRSSPINYLKNCKTPTLIMHGTGDVRVPSAQAWEIYRALIDLGVKTKMILYPGAPHGINSDPRYLVDVITNWIDWNNEYIKN